IAGDLVRWRNRKLGVLGFSHPVDLPKEQAIDDRLGDLGEDGRSVFEALEADQHVATAEQRRILVLAVSAGGQPDTALVRAHQYITGLDHNVVQLPAVDADLRAPRAGRRSRRGSAWSIIERVGAPSSIDAALWPRVSCM